VHAGLHSDDAKSRASARELIEHVVDGDLREPLLALTDDVPDAARLRRLQPYHQPPAVQYQALLEQLLADGSEAVRCIAAYHIGELHMEALREPLAAARPAHAGYLADVFDHALGLLARPRVEEVAQRAP
jgi:HEAT repeat protein